MGDETEKGEIELIKFQEFLGKSGMPVGGSIVNKQAPPEPDILYWHEQVGCIRFELVEICDWRLAKNIGDTIKSGNGGVSYIRTCDPTPTIVYQKFIKEYPIGYPIELLCYTAGRVVTPADAMISQMELLAGSQSGPFRRIWLLDKKAHFVWQESTDCFGPELAEFG